MYLFFVLMSCDEWILRVLLLKLVRLTFQILLVIPALQLATRAYPGSPKEGYVLNTATHWLTELAGYLCRGVEMYSLRSQAVGQSGRALAVAAVWLLREESAGERFSRQRLRGYGS